MILIRFADRGLVVDGKPDLLLFRQLYWVGTNFCRSLPPEPLRSFLSLSLLNLAGGVCHLLHPWDHHVPSPPDVQRHIQTVHSGKHSQKNTGLFGNFFQHGGGSPSDVQRHIQTVHTGIYFTNHSNSTFEPLGSSCPICQARICLLEQLHSDEESMKGRIISLVYPCLAEIFNQYFSRKVLVLVLLLVSSPWSTPALLRSLTSTSPARY